ncbi:unnamed protein product [Mycena citricolor]|uniref:Golgi apparatus membrane protein tvp38 n=1 Tax=Mycena citricolor TaxID=2018698 RepID=A0AAD2GTE6_9AGAR|nr:unnamed protein product [Mycena citricolor]
MAMPYPAYAGRPPPVDSQQSLYPPKGPFDRSNTSFASSSNALSKSPADARNISRTPSPTPSEYKALDSGLFNREDLLKWRFWIRKEWIKYYIIGILVGAITALITIFHTQIVHYLIPMTNFLHQQKYGILVPIGVLFVISFPPLFGHEIIAVLCGVVWGLWVGFGIVCAGTFLGEVGNFYAFKYLCRARGEKMERQQIRYACLAECVRRGGFRIALIARFSAIPGHFTTAIFATCGMNIFVFSIAAALSLPKQFVTVYLGVVLEQSTTGQKDLKNKLISYAVVGVTVLVTVLAMWYIYREMNLVKPQVIYARRKARQVKQAKGDLYAQPDLNDSDSSVTGYNPRQSLSDIPLTASRQFGPSSQAHPRYDYEQAQKQQRYADWMAQHQQPQTHWGGQEDAHQRWDDRGNAIGYTPGPVPQVLYAPQPQVASAGRTPIEPDAYTESQAYSSGMVRESMDAVAWDTQMRERPKHHDMYQPQPQFQQHQPIRSPHPQPGGGYLSESPAPLEPETPRAQYAAYPQHNLGAPLGSAPLPTPPYPQSPFADPHHVAHEVEPTVDPLTSVIYHIEKRPHEGGRHTLVKSDTREDLTPAWDVRTTVNGYGGAPAIVHDSRIFFSDARDGRVYMMSADGSCSAVTPANPNHKFADFDVHPLMPHLLIGIMEDATESERPALVVNSLVVLDTAERVVYPFMSDASFYRSPKFSPDGKRVVWIEWDLPDMPWNGSEIWVADFARGETPQPFGLANPRHVAGEHGRIAVAYPSWASEDVVLFTSDISGFENPWVYDCNSNEARQVFKTPISEGFALRDPPKRNGESAYAVLGAPHAIFTAVRDGRSVLYLVDLQNGQVQLISSTYVEISQLRTVSLDPAVITFIGIPIDAPSTVVRCTLGNEAQAEFTDLMVNSHGSDIPPAFASRPHPMSIGDGTSKIHAIFYPPTNPDFIAPMNEKPPAIVSAHGGPVGMAPQSFNLTREFFTSRGWAWIDVNYGGSSGYGREYLERLHRGWGIVDADDCIAVVKAISSPPYQLIDPQRVVVRGASAGGFAVLTLLSVRAAENVFAGGTSLYGVVDLPHLLEGTHKFESGYLAWLVSDDEAMLQERSPISHVDKITAPILILVASLKNRGCDFEFKIYEGEGHGWKKKDTIKDALCRELQFYNRIIGIQA